jgi:hypothetical protein
MIGGKANMINGDLGEENHEFGKILAPPVSNQGIELIKKFDTIDDPPRTMNQRVNRAHQTNNVAPIVSLNYQKFVENGKQKK